MRIWILILTVLIGGASCQKAEPCAYYAYIYEAKGNLVITLGPFSNKKKAASEAKSFILSLDEIGYTYRIELQSNPNCVEAEESMRP